MAVLENIESQPIVHELIRQRWSPRAFEPTPIETVKLQRLFEAARWASSAGNMQPWRFIIATHDQPEIFARIYDSLADGNKRWTADVPVLGVIVAKLYERPGLERNSYFDAGLAMSNLVIEAANQNLVVHQMGGFSADKIRQSFGIPLEYIPLSTFAIGYQGDAANLPEDLRERELAIRTRLPLSDIVFDDTWGKAADVTLNA